MSKITISEGINVSIADSIIKVTGSKGEMTFPIPAGIKVELKDNQVIVSQENTNDRFGRAAFGLTRASLANMIKGTGVGFEKKLELVGVGYRAQMQGSDLVLSLGYSHPVKFKPLTGVEIKVEDNVISVTGIDKMLVGQAADKIRSIRPPEPYKGKGIKYVGEYVRRKAGKAAKAVGATK